MILPVLENLKLGLLEGIILPPETAYNRRAILQRDDPATYVVIMVLVEIFCRGKCSGAGMGMVDSEQPLSTQADTSKRFEQFTRWNRELNLTLPLITAMDDFIDSIVVSYEQPTTLEGFLFSGMLHYLIKDIAQDDHRELLHQVNRININRHPPKINLLRPECTEGSLQHVM